MAKHPFAAVFTLLLLAALCIGAVELSVARYEDRELYDSVTAPVRDAYDDARTQLDAYLEQKAAERAAELERRRLQAMAQQIDHDLSQQEERRRAAEDLAAAELSAQLASAPTIREELLRADPTITELIRQGIKNTVR